MEPRIIFLVPRLHVKRVKTVLEQHDLLDRKTKIAAVAADEEQGQPRDSRMALFTTINPTQSEIQDMFLDDERKSTLTGDLALDDLKEEIDIILQNSESTGATTTRNPFTAAIIEALNKLPPSLLEVIHISHADLINEAPTTYSIYKPMLLLPPNAFDSPPWKTLFSAHGANHQDLQPLWTTIASSMNVTHIAINAGIPLSKAQPTTTKPQEVENILRSPLNLTPLHGAFHPLPTPQTLTSPTPSDLSSTLWVSTSQNGIVQVWAPLYTMFSRGNIREKTRLLTLPSVTAAVTQGAEEEQGCTAVDLYAGIGYFSFSYRRAGVAKVLCWELNPWSVEGLRRGAERNRWKTAIFHDAASSSPSAVVSTLRELDEEGVDFAVFQQSNEFAAPVVRALREGGVVPRVRHVNLGFLPSSRGAWRTAVRVVDAEVGGWVHVHENVGVGEIEGRAGEVVEAMQGFLDEWDGELGRRDGGRRRVVWEHTERIKTYAPGVWHVVFDVRVEGWRDVEG
ncbi:hypothetical protein BU24DRAFT_68240 [Aaosphaeria arxii CBS 175.79]|uniref:tRNA(Phe) (4-demethylwyosine(37)-C(7)) aminocarboxypropyltransferase n=1 Tax=Aaosphaeria arxii CBS 175.79 TaxID=1450172 RepID=A0A6A5XAH7_9PLEO|nr:uncharacterized protein BU24DRAFT_68240 [Aaosphaeria arxii CBS 175.79]KAF2009962.1 hypothetical protein BU24DRAFT_68240 [Aaosphaeria arxii CBS 175.79]